MHRLLSALPSGSALVISHGTPDFDPEAARKAEKIYRRGGITMQGRSKEEVARFFTGLDLVEPGIELTHRWRPDSGEEMPRIGSQEIKDADIPIWAGVALKP